MTCCLLCRVNPVEFVIYRACEEWEPPVMSICDSCMREISPEKLVAEIESAEAMSVKGIVL